VLSLGGKRLSVRRNEATLEVMRDLIETNRRQWDERTAIHVGSSFYDVESFKAGRCSLHPVEVAELGDVEGKRLLHLQCHFGLDTLSWVRRGAVATGADFSQESVAVAQQLAEDLGVEARFVCSDIYELTDNLDGRFDIVFTSYGVLTWLPDLDRWAQTIEQFLDEDGVFYIVEQHPIGNALVEEDGKIVVADAYFDVGPIECPGDGTYADLTATLKTGVSYQWQHSLSDVINALTSVGLRIEFLHEFPFGEWQRLPSMEQREDGYWQLPGRDDLPFLFSLRARKA
jgi:2-polyprenyl-3-methyl-5-hydroxy-6-metoxy-1,4-benzoquinol methylase